MDAIKLGCAFNHIAVKYNVRLSNSIESHKFQSRSTCCSQYFSNTHNTRNVVPVLAMPYMLPTQMLAAIRTRSKMFLRMYKSLSLEHQELLMINILKNNMIDPSTETGDWNGANKLMSIPQIAQPDQTTSTMNDALAACSIVISLEEPTA